MPIILEKTKAVLYYIGLALDIHNLTGLVIRGFQSLAFASFVVAITNWVGDKVPALTLILFGIASFSFLMATLPTLRRLGHKESPTKRGTTLISGIIKHSTTRSKKGEIIPLNNTTPASISQRDYGLHQVKIIHATIVTQEKCLAIMESLDWNIEEDSLRTQFAEGNPMMLVHIQFTDKLLDEWWEIEHMEINFGSVRPSRFMISTKSKLDGSLISTETALFKCPKQPWQTRPRLVIKVRIREESFHTKSFPIRL